MEENTKGSETETRGDRRKKIVERERESLTVEETRQLEFKGRHLLVREVKHNTNSPDKSY